MRAGRTGAVAVTRVSAKTFQDGTQKTGSQTSTARRAFPADLHDGEHHSEPRLREMPFLQKLQPSD